MNRQFNIKISDLLEKPGQIDSIELEGVFSKEIKDLDKKGIYGTLELKSLNSDSVFAKLEDINCELKKTCDSCQNKYIEPISVNEYEAEFTHDKQKLIDDDSSFPIDNGNVINIEDMLSQSIILQESINNYCSKCQTEIDTNNIGEEEKVDNLEGTGNVSFLYPPDKGG